MPFEQPQAIRTIFFDAGFTLLRPYPSIAEICQKVCQQLGLHVNLSEVEERMDEAEDYFLRQSRNDRHTWASEQAINEFWTGYYMTLLRSLVVEHDEPRLYQLARAINEEFDKHTSWEIFPDVLPVLQTLRARNYTLGVISDWGIALGPILRQHALSRYFDCLLVSATTRYAKPSPMLYHQALERANAVPDYALHIGDSYIHDVLGARSVGMTPVLIDRAEKFKPENVDCLLVHSLYEILDLLEIPRP
jgi:putative hydrolase of the HAD superfamily